MGNYTQAISFYDKALAIDPNNKYTLYDKSNALYNLGKYNEAISSYDKALAVQPKNIDALVGKGDALDILGNHTQAIKYYEKALAMDPKNRDALFGILQSKNVSIEAINEHIHLKQELEKHGLDIRDTYRLLNLLTNAKQYEFDAKKIVAKLSCIRPLEKKERGLRNNCIIFAKQLDKYKEIIPLVEKIVAMKIGISELLALDAAVSETAEQNNLPIPAAAFRVINDIKDYNRVGGLKKQLVALCAQVCVVKEVCAHQNKVILSLVRLYSHGITEEQILYLNNVSKRNSDKLIELDLRPV